MPRDVVGPDHLADFFRDFLGGERIVNGPHRVDHGTVFGFLLQFGFTGGIGIVDEF